MDKDTILAVIDKFDSSGLAELDWKTGDNRLILRKATPGVLANKGAECAGSAEFHSVEPSSSVEPAHSASESLKQIEDLRLSAAPPQRPPVFAQTQTAASRETPPHAAVSAPAAAGKVSVITSPLVATYYASSSPDAPPFVRPGARVKKGDTLCILEAMKAMNHLEAEFDCEILSCLAKSGDLIEFGQALFEASPV